MPKITNVFIAKMDDDPKVLAINVTDTESSDPDVKININYDDLNASEKADFDAFQALAESKIPA